MKHILTFICMLILTPAILQAQDSVIVLQSSAPANTPSADAHKMDMGAALSFIHGLEYEKNGDFAKAFELYSQIIKKDPSAYSVYAQAVNSGLRSGNTARALELAQTLVEKEPVSDNYVIAANAYFAFGNYAKAEEYYKKAFELDNQNLDVLYKLAMLSEVRKDVPAAVNYLLEYLKYDSVNAAKVYYEIAMLYFRENKDINKVIEYVKKTIDIAPDALDLKYVLAGLYVNIRDYNKALEIYEEIGKQNGFTPNLLLLMAEVHEKNADFDNMQGALLKVKEADPSNNRANLWLSEINAKMSKYDLAHKYIVESSSYPVTSGLQINASYFLAMQGNLKEAVATLAGAAKKWPDNADVIYYYALGLSDLGDKKQALKYFEKTLELDPSRRQARLKAAVLYEDADDIKNAEKHFKILLETDPENTTYLNYLGYSLADRGLKLDEAQGYLIKATELAPEEPAYLDSLGWLYYKKGDYDKALEYIIQAFKTTVYDWEIWFHLAEIYSKKGNHEAAWYAYYSAHSLNMSAKKNQLIEAGLKKSARSIKAEKLAGLNALQLKNFYSGFSTFISAGQLKFQYLDNKENYLSMLEYGDGELKFKVLFGPLMDTAFEFASILGADGKYRVKTRAFDKAFRDPKLEENLKVLAEFLHGYLSGSIYEGKVSVSSVSGKNYIKTQNYTIGIDTLYKPVSLSLNTGSSILMKIGSFKNEAGYVVPGEIEFAAPGFKAVLKLGSARFTAGINALTLIDEFTKLTQNK